MVKKWVILVLTLFTGTNLVPAASRAAAAARAVAPAVERLVEQARAHSTRTPHSSNSNTPSDDNDDRDTTQDTPEDRGELSSMNPLGAPEYTDSNDNNDEETPLLPSESELATRDYLRSLFGLKPLDRSGQMTQESAAAIQEARQRASSTEGLRDLLSSGISTNRSPEAGVARHLQEERAYQSLPAGPFVGYPSYSAAVTDNLTIPKDSHANEETLDDEALLEEVESIERALTTPSQEIITYQAPRTQTMQKAFQKLNFIQDQNGVWRLTKPKSALTHYQQLPTEIMPRTAASTSLMVPKQQSLGLQLFDQPQTTLAPYTQQETALTPYQQQPDQVIVFIEPETLAALFQATDEELDQLLQNLINPEVNQQNALVPYKKQSSALMPFGKKQTLDIPQQDTPKIEVHINAQDLQTLLAQAPAVRADTIRNLIRNLAQKAAQPKQEYNKAALAPQSKKPLLALEEPQPVARPMELVKSTAHKMPEASFLERMAERIKDFIEPAKKVAPVAGAAALAAHPKTRIITKRLGKPGLSMTQQRTLRTNATRQKVTDLKKQVAHIQKELQDIKHAQMKTKAQIKAQQKVSKQQGTYQQDTAELQKTAELDAALRRATQAEQTAKQRMSEIEASALRQRAELDAQTTRHNALQDAAARIAQAEQAALRRTAEAEQSAMRRAAELEAQATRNIAERTAQAEREAARIEAQATRQSTVQDPATRTIQPRELTLQRPTETQPVIEPTLLQRIRTLFTRNTSRSQNQPRITNTIRTRLRNFETGLNSLLTFGLGYLLWPWTNQPAQTSNPEITATPQTTTTTPQPLELNVPRQNNPRRIFDRAEEDLDALARRIFNQQNQQPSALDRTNQILTDAVNPTLINIPYYEPQGTQRRGQLALPAPQSIPARDEMGRRIFATDINPAEPTPIRNAAGRRDFAPIIRPERPLPARDEMGRRIFATDTEPTTPALPTTADESRLGSYSIEASISTPSSREDEPRVVAIPLTPPTDPTPAAPIPAPRPTAPTRSVADASTGTETTPSATQEAPQRTRSAQDDTTDTDYDNTDRTSVKDSATDTQTDKPYSPGFPASPEQKTAPQQEEQQVIKNTQPIPQQTPFNRGYNKPRIQRTAPTTNSFATRPLPRSQTFQAPFRGLSSSMPQVSEKAQSPKVSSTIFNDTPTTPVIRKPFIPRDTGTHFDTTLLKRKPAPVKETPHLDKTSNDKIKKFTKEQQTVAQDSPETKIETPPTKKVPHWTLTLWNNIQSFGVKIKNFLRPLMFWIH